MQKLLELEKKLKEAKEQLEKFGSQGAPLSSGGLGASIAAGLSGGVNIKKEETCKADSTNKYGAQQEAKRINTVNETRQPAKVISGGQTSIVSPESQIKAKKDFAANKKAKAESEAKTRRDAMRQEGILKGDDLDKKVREPTITSPSSFENAIDVEGAAKKKKYQGGDPRHFYGPSKDLGGGVEQNTPNRKTRAGREREVPEGKGTFTSGSSSLRHGTKIDDYKRDKTNDTTGKEVTWGKSIDERLDDVLETLEKAMYFGGESTKTSTHGEARNSKGGDKNFPHYDYDTSSSDKENYDAAQKHFEDHKHTYAAHPAGLKQYLVGRKKMAEEGR